MKGISSIIAILGLCVIMTAKAAPVDTSSDKEKNITDINNSINVKLFNDYIIVLQKEQGVGIPSNNSL
jgi:predicted transglutaminase-like cysteine proteinase